MTRNKFIAAALAASGLFAGATAHAGGVQWSVSIGLPAPPPLSVQIHGRSPGVYFYAPPQRHVVAPPPYHGRHHRRGWDRDRDGIPDRHDRIDNRRWDADGDGIPNRYDRHDNPRGDRDRDGVRNWRDRHEGGWR